LSFSIETSGPLKTLGSFMSFHVKRLGVDPAYRSYVNRSAHQDRTRASVKSR
jgi:hypothetical protein